MRRRLARIAHHLRAHTPRPGHIHLQPEVTRRRLVLIPHQAKVAAVATEVAVAEEVTEAVVAAAEVAAEVLTAEDPLLTLDTKFSAQNGKSPAGPYRRAFSVLNYMFFKILSNSKFNT